MNPNQLLCEYQENPIGVDHDSPRLSWQCTTSNPGNCQTAYRVQIEDLWDTGKVTSPKAMHVIYSGEPLVTNRLYRWRVCLWDQDDQATPWSSWATFHTGFMSPDDWQARWIKSPANRIEPTPSMLAAAHWIWAVPEGSSPLPAALGSCTFTKSFELKSDDASATVLLAADNQARIFLNGQQLAETQHWQHGIEVDCSKALHRGENHLRIEAENKGDCAKIAGVIFGLRITHKNGEQQDVISDQTWSSEASASEEDLVIHEIAPWGQGPWGAHVYFDPHRHIAQPVFRRFFDVEELPTEAMVHISGVGQFQLLLNDQLVGDALIDPPWSVYEKTRYYRSFSVVNMLKPGKNEWRIVMGKGFHNSIGDRIVHHTHRSGEVMAILEAHLSFSDGHEMVITSDDRWEVGHGPLTHDTMLGGCDYDARHEQPQEWHAAIETETTASLLQSESPPMKAFGEVSPVRDVEEPQKGIFVYDFGQNVSAIPKVMVRGKAGQRLRISPAEQRQGQTDRCNNGTGIVDQAGVGTPNHYDLILSDKEVESWQPPCTYSGFQYLQLEGAVPLGHPNPENLPVVEKIHSRHVRSSAAEVGSFSCSNPLWNKIDEIIDRAIRSNLAHVLTDCPTREKLGWLEVPYLMGPSISRRYDLSRLYAKVTRDIRDTQGERGQIYTTAPSYATFDPHHRIGYTLEWGAAGVVIPWQLYRWYGDDRILAENYGMMKSFITYIQETSNDLIPKPGLGDWFDYGHGHPRGASRFTPPELTACATFYRCTKILAETADVLGHDDDAALYQNLAQDIHQRFNQEFYCGQGIYKNHGSPQTANAMALSLNLCPESDQKEALQVLLDDLEKRDHQQTAGDVGFHYLIDTLSRHECHDVVSKMLNRRDEGSYGFSIDRGWTALPEAWEAATKESMNHCMLGHAQQWFSHELIGIHQADDSIAFEHIVIKPAIVSDISWARGHYDCIRGRIASEWSKQGKGLTIKIEIPPNARFSLHLPVQEHQKIIVNQQAIEEHEGLQSSEPRHGVVIITGGSGSYEIITI